MQAGKGGEQNWLLSVGYGSPNPALRKYLWQDLNSEVMEIEGPWLIMGDFNSVSAAEEVSNHGKLDKRRCAGFVEWISDPNLLDLGFSGPRFTWTRGSTADTFKGGRLDKALCNMEWRFLFDSASISHLRT